MRKILSGLVLLLPVWVHAQQFTLKGKVQTDSLITGIVSISYDDDGRYVRDTCPLKDNSYYFKGSIKHGAAVVASLTWSNGQGRNGFRGFAQFYITPGNISVVHQQRFDKFEVQGSALQKDIAEYEVARKSKDTGSANAFIRSHPKSWLSYVQLEEMTRTSRIDASTADGLYKMLDAGLKKYDLVKTLGERINGLNKAIVGNMAMDFVQNDTLGKPVRLSSFRGKYVLVDFWASWCHPCRDEIPFIVKMYDRFKSRNFEVLGVSLDAGDYGRNVWLKAIRDDGAFWTQVSDLKGGKNEAALLYGVTAIPRNFLIDPQGRIIAKDLHGEELERKLEETL